ncbi:U-box domain-containing protein 3 isoform X2 [Prunus yedoensis var. nudiflora]|uniref:U-box domain-containing protein 3 isoform X2 n=1 Tax=Prunus yedoensis var. nudiflora TaxID=2094558 RepID=A0A314UFN7_PRUYE|nr:U-box domain-containing protein 3 isoform X2 [Prunus yedoensis var. nudiflora]
MDMASIKCLINSISRFVHLVSSQRSKPMPIQKDYRTIVDGIHGKLVSKVEQDFKCLRGEPLLITIQSSSLKICSILSRLLQSSSSGSSLIGLQHCMQEIRCLKQERVTEYLEEALKSQRKDTMPSTKHLMKIIELLSLSSNQELLKESIAVEKERMNVEVSDVRGN